MNKSYYLFSDGELLREDDSLRLNKFDGEFERIPIKTIDSLFCFGQITYNTSLLHLLNKHTIEMHIFGWNDQYLGSHIPTKNVKSGNTIIQQVEFYQHPQKRSDIATEIVVSSIHNMKSNLQYYSRKDNDFSEEISKLEEVVTETEKVDTVDEIMGYEATARKKYYGCFDEILSNSKLSFDSREYNPPSSEVNALISFLNMLVYSNVTSAIRQTALEPTIGFLHTPGNRRDSLSLDIADVFKPILADRCLFRLLNRQQVTENSFDDSSNYRLKEKDRKIVLKEFEGQIQETIEHPDLNRKVSFKTLLKLEAYKLKKQFLMDVEYQGFKRWW